MKIKNIEINFEWYFGFLFGLGYKKFKSKLPNSFVIFIPFVGIIIEW